MNVGSLFSGIGGIDLGLKRAGHTVQWQCEADEWRRSVLAERFPGVPCYPDVRGVGLGGRDDGATEARTHGSAASGNVDRHADLRVDVVCGGFPCQDLSVAGRRAGFEAGERSSLFFEYARIADALLAPGGWILIENVPGLLSSNSGRDFAVLLATLAELGFHDLAWRVLDSRHFGVPQRRRRVFILARRAHGRRACEVLLEPESSSGDPPPSREAGPGVARTLADRSAGGSRRDASVEDFVTAGLADRPAVSEHYYVEDFDRHPMIAATLSSGGHPNSNMPGRRKEDDVNVVAAWSEGTNGFAPSPVAGTIDQQRRQFVNGVRRLTPTECERLQGFPDGWTDRGPDSRRYAALGDAVTVNVAQWIGQRLATHA